MPYDFILPDLGEGITEGEIVKWLVKEGDRVEEHQVVLEIETDKAIVEVPSPRKGKVLKIHKLNGDIAKVGEPLMTIEEDGAKGKKVSVSVVGSMPEAEEFLATPAVRNLAKRLGVDISKIKGTGHAGRVTEKDVRETAATVKGKGEDRFGPVECIPMKGVRRSIAKNLITSQRMTASVTGMDEADVTELWNLRENEKERAKEKGINLTFMPFFMKVAQHALKSHPLLNGSVDEEKEEIIIKRYFDFGIAVDTPDGLMVPVIRGVDKKTILQLASELQELSLRARERKIKIEELKGSTFTLSNFGSFGGIFGTPIINYPDIAVLGTGRISDRAWVKEGNISIRKILPLSLTFDHRVVDGSEAARFLNKVIGYLEDPGSVFIEST